MSENPWKKQADANKAQQGPGTGTVPAWMKGKADQTQQQAQSTPPPAFKPPASQPAPVGNPAGGNVPAWMKNKQASSTNPVVKPGPPVPATSGNVPAWMKNKQSAQSPAPTDRSNEQLAKQKQEQQARLKQQQEEEARLREEEQTRKAEEARVKAEQEEAARLQQEQKAKKSPNKKSQRNPMEKSASKNISKSGGKSLQNSTPFHNYLSCFNQACSKHQQYQQKLEYQRNYMIALHKFCVSSQGSIVQYLSQRKITQRKKNVINLENLYIEFAVVEGVSDDGDSTYFRTRAIEQLEQKFRLYQLLHYLMVRLMKKMPIFRLRVPLLSKVSHKGLEFLCEGVCDQLLDSVLSPAESYIEIHGELLQLEKQLHEAGFEDIGRSNFMLKKITLDNSDFYLLYLNESVNNLKPETLAALGKLTLQPGEAFNLENIRDLKSVAGRLINLGYTNMANFEQIKRKTSQKFQASYLSLFELAHAIRIVYASCQGELDELTFWGLVFEGNPDIWALVRKAYRGVYGQAGNKFMLAKILQMMVPVTFATGRDKKRESNGQVLEEKQPVFLESRPLVAAYPPDSLEYYEVTQLLGKNIGNPLKARLVQESYDIQAQISDATGQLFVTRLDVVTNKIRMLYQNGISSKVVEQVTEAIRMAENYAYPKGKQAHRLVIYPLLITMYMGAAACRNWQGQSARDSQTSKKQSQKQEAEIRATQQVELESRQGQQTPTKTSRPEEYEQKMLQTFNKLLEYLSELFDGDTQIWTHASLFTLFASYYSKTQSSQDKWQSPIKDISSQKSSKIEQKYKKVGFFSGSAAYEKSKNAGSPASGEKGSYFSESKAESEPTLEYKPQAYSELRHPYHRQCLKFLEMAQQIYLSYYGSLSNEMADFLLSASEVYLNIGEIEKSEGSAREALKIYKGSSKHAINVLSCQVLHAKALIEGGARQSNKKLIEEGISSIQEAANELYLLGLVTQSLEIYQYLYTCVSQALESALSPSKQSEQAEWHQNSLKAHRLQKYLQRILQVSLQSKQVSYFKRGVRCIVKNEISNYCKDRVVALRQLHQDYLKQEAVEEETQTQRMERYQELLVEIEEEKQTFGGIGDLLKWSLNILKVKSDNSQTGRAESAIKLLLGLFSERQIESILKL